MESYSSSFDLEEQAAARNEDDRFASLQIHTHLRQESTDERWKIQENFNERREKADRCEKEVHVVHAFATIAE